MSQIVTSNDLQEQLSPYIQYKLVVKVEDYEAGKLIRIIDQDVFMAPDNEEDAGPLVQHNYSTLFCAIYTNRHGVIEFIEHNMIAITKGNRDAISHLCSYIGKEVSIVEKETIWRLQEDDFLMIMEDEFPGLSEEQRDELIDLAHRKFSIEDWSEQVRTFVQVHAEEKGYL